MSRKAAIEAKCKECIHDPVGGRGTWRQQVEACTSPKCPLYPYRPTSRGGRVDLGSGAQDAAIFGPSEAEQEAA